MLEVVKTKLYLVKLYFDEIKIINVLDPVLQRDLKHLLFKCKFYSCRAMFKEVSLWT